MKSLYLPDLANDNISINRKRKNGTVISCWYLGVYVDGIRCLVINTMNGDSTYKL